MSSVHWAEPPPIGGPQDPRALYMEKLRPLTARPGEWAIIKAGSPSAMQQTATALKQRRWNVPPGGWEFTVRTFRRGVHVGDMNTANLYARYLGADDNRPREVSDRAVFDEDGFRVCEDCGARLPRPSEGGGAWARKCDICWAKSDPKWLRKRSRLRRLRRDQRAAGTYVDPRRKPGWKLEGDEAFAYMRDVMGIPEAEL